MDVDICDLGNGTNLMDSKNCDLGSADSCLAGIIIARHTVPNYWVSGNRFEPVGDVKSFVRHHWMMVKVMDSESQLVNEQTWIWVRQESS